MKKTRHLLSLILVMSLALGNIEAVMLLPETYGLRYNHQESQTSEHPPFQPPALNASKQDSGSIFINGQEIFWSYFSPNTSIIQPRDFGFSFEIWWNNPDPNISIVVELSDNEGGANSTETFETLGSYEKVLETQEGDFIQYAIWMNTTYFFANETWSTFGNESIDVEDLNLTVGIQHFTYFPIFEYSILRDSGGPTLQIIHPTYDEIRSEIVLDSFNISFDIVVTDLSKIEYAALVATFVNQTTFEPDEMVMWGTGNIENGTGQKVYVPSLITEKIVIDSGGMLDIDTTSI
ncbi:MAG: hypothetical protein ACFFE7_15265, partial [Candidatus Thorarchaeota archaeon]